MFKQINILMSAPICKCEEQNIKWAVGLENNKPYLVLTCVLCEVKLIIPNVSFIAGFIFDKPYPKGIKSVKEETKIEKAGKLLRLVPLEDKPKEA